MNDEKNYLVADFEKIIATPCPCGKSKRAFVREDNQVASMHVVEISQDSRPNYHKKMTEIYYVLEGEGHLEIDGDKVPLKPGVSVLIPPNSLHRAVGKLKLINVPVPTFDPADEWFVD
jgi:mannose-6-phosphate isomerase-like protein (cupin superfamily)